MVTLGERWSSVHGSDTCRVFFWHWDLQGPCLERCLVVLGLGDCHLPFPVAVLPSFFHSVQQSLSSHKRRLAGTKPMTHFFQIKALPQIVFNWFAYLGGFFWDPSTSNLWGFLFVCFAGVRGKMKIWLCLRAAAPDILTMCSWRWPAHSEVYEQPSLVSPADKLQRHPCASTVQFITAHSGSLRTCCNFSYYHPSAFYESLGKHFLLSQNSFALAEH